MKLIIDVSNDIYERWSNIEMPTVREVRDVQEAMKVATPIPDNATNLDVFVAIFKGTPDISMCPVFCISKDDVKCQCDINTCTCGDWWNAPI